MKKLLLLVITCIMCGNVIAQSTLKDRLYYTTKVWGFVKYYHSNVSTCHVNWDSVLVSVLPAVRTAANDSEFNDALDTMLAAAGPMAIATDYFPDTLPAALKRNRDFSWMSAGVFRSDVQVMLDTIKNNFRPHTECWVSNNDYTGSYGGWLIFPYDSLELDVNTYTSYPDEDHRLLMFMKYWNVVRYFYPYNYSLDIPWDSTLAHYILPIDSVTNGNDLYLLCEHVATALNDAHVEGLTFSEYYFQPPGYYQPHVRIMYTDSEYVVIRSTVSGINVGDVITSVDGLTVNQWEDSIKPYVSAGNPSVFRRFVCSYMMAREVYAGTESITLRDSTGAENTHTVTCFNPYTDEDFYYNWYYPADSLNNIRFTTMDCGVGYMNIGNLSIAGTDSAYAALRNAPAIIVDLRNYPIDASAFELADLMYASPTEFAKFTVPDVTYPGTYFWEGDVLGLSAPDAPYTGKVILLINEQTQSAAEFDCMILGALPNVVRVGSQTAGTDGNITNFRLTQDMYTGFTSLGVYYPNGDTTERIGIVPDSVVQPSATDIRHHNDAVLNKALQIAGCNLAVHNVPAATATVHVYPNPAYDIVNVSVTNTGAQNVVVTLTDVTGRTLTEEKHTGNSGTLTVPVNISTLPAGIYVARVVVGDKVYVQKIAKEQ